MPVEHKAGLKQRKLSQTQVGAMQDVGVQRTHPGTALGTGSFIDRGYLRPWVGGQGLWGKSRDVGRHSIYILRGCILEGGAL